MECLKQGVNGVLSVACLCILLQNVPANAAIDAPHNDSNNISCGSCHNPSVPNSPLWVAGADINAFCMANCHGEVAPPYSGSAAPLAMGHSSANTSARYGSWSTQCTDCHDPHNQRQKLWKSTNGADLYLATGTVTGYSCFEDANTNLVQDAGEQSCQAVLEAGGRPAHPVSVLTYTSGSFKSGWSLASIVDKTGPERYPILLPNTGRTASTYPLVAMDATTISVEGNVGPLYKYALPPTPFGIIYGQFLRNSIDYPATGTSLKFFDKQGNYSFVRGNGSGICETCHSQPDHYRKDGSGPDQAHVNIEKLKVGNPNLDTSNCMFCHNHQDGFRPSCPDCHGYPPLQSTAGGPDGLVGPGPNLPAPGVAYGIPAATGSATNGQHELHATAAGYDYPCATCHMGGMTTTMTATDAKVDQQIQIGFSGVATSGAIDASGMAYDGQTLANGYSYQGENNTTCTQTGSRTCLNVYCHSDGKALVDPVGYAPENYPPGYPPLLNPPVWGEAAWDPQGDVVKCNNCHDKWPRYDSHDYHLVRRIFCDVCHFGVVDDVDGDDDFETILDRNRHANGTYDVIPAPTYTKPNGTQMANSFVYTPAPGGGTCSSNLCHQDYRFTDPKTWGNRAIPTELAPFVSWAPSGAQQCGVGGSIGRNIQFSLAPNCTYCTSPYTLSVNWGDNPADPDTLTDIQATSAIHTYNYNYNPANPADHPDRLYTIKWRLKDAEGITIPAPDPRETRVVVCPQANTPPSFSVSYCAGTDPNTYDIVVTLSNAVDPDYNAGSHDPAYPAKVQINWGDFSSDVYNVTLTNVPSTHQFTHTYPRSAYWWIDIDIDDNAPEQGYVSGTYHSVKVEKTRTLYGGVYCP